MEFKIAKKDFLEGLAQTQGVVEKKNTMPVLSNVLLEGTVSQAEKQGLKISATDLEVAVVCQCPAQVLQGGKITVPARSLHDIVREVDQTEMTIKVDAQDRLELISGSSRFKIPGLNAKEFPSLPKVEAKSVEVPCEFFRNMVEKTSFSMSTDETRYNLNGVLLHKEGVSKEKEGEIRMVATDGHRLALVDQKVPAGFETIKVIIPRKGVSELRKMVSGEGSFELGLGPKNLFARKGSVSLYIRLVDGEYPDYSRVIPKDNDKIASIPRTPFIGALRRVSLLSNERSRGVVLSLSSGHLEVSTNNPDLGEAREEIMIDYKGPNMNIGFNARYFLDVLDVIRDEKIVLAFKDELSPCLIRSEYDRGFQSVIMPMRI